MAEPQEHRVTIFSHGGKTIVWPPYVVVKAEDYITFSTVDTSATVVVPNCLAFKCKKASDTTATPEEINIESTGGAEGIIRVQQDSAVRVQTEEYAKALASIPEDEEEVMRSGNTQIYAFSVYGRLVNDLGQGQSSPVLIIEPPQKGPGP